MQPSRYLKFYPSQAEPDSVLIYSTLRGSKLTVSTALAERIRQGEVADAELGTLARLGIMVDDAGAERERLRSIFELHGLHGRRFTALVTLNLDCNLACGYCYEDHFRGKKYMDEQTADLLVRTLLEGPLQERKEIRLDFYGGEALLSVALIRRISQPLLEQAKLRGSSYGFNLITNGTLLHRRMVAELLPLGLRGARITLDGPPEVHDRQRPFASGRGSFSSIVANLKEICDLLPVQVGGNFSKENYRLFPELLDRLTEEGITPDRLDLVTFAPILPAAGEAGQSEFPRGCACSSEPWLLEASLYLREEILRRGFNAPKPRVCGCIVEFENEVVVGYDGSLYKCPAFMGWPDLRVGTLSTGVGDYRGSHDVGAWKNEECLECAYLPLCFGGCRFLRRLNTGSVTGVDCRKQALDATLEGFVRQDLTLRREDQRQK